MKKTILIAGMLLLQYSGIAQEKIGIATDLPRTTLDVNGKLTVRDTGYMENAGHIKPLYVDDETGLVGTVAPEAPTAAVSVLISNNSNLPSNAANAAKFNEGDTDLNVPIISSHFYLNNLGLKIDNNTIEIQEDGAYQINSYLNVAISTPSNNEDRKITVNFSTVNIKTGEPISPTQEIPINSYYQMIFLYAKLYKNGSEIAGTRPILTSILNGQANLITLPTATVKLKKGDKLSLAFSRTKTGGGTPAGSDVTSIGLTSNFGAKPYSISITKL